jgi:predicted nucleotide-binding protein
MAAEEIDLEKWARDEIRHLSEFRVAIVCLTPENISASALSTQVSAMWASIDRALIIPYLLGVSRSELVGPLVEFQVTTATHDGTYSLVSSINRALNDKAVSEDLLKRSFARWWPDLESKLRVVVSKVSAGDVLGERGGEVSSRGLSAADSELLDQFVRRISSVPTHSQHQERDSVFLVHGRNQGQKELVARFLERVGASVVILHEVADEGRTIIEKFELHAHVNYAVVLMSADDLGGADAAGLSRRARQNVLLELGFFIAKLGRRRLSVLYEEGVELPSDMAGVLYILLDEAGAWKLQLARELRTAALRVDLNLAL